MADTTISPRAPERTARTPTTGRGGHIVPAEPVLAEMRADGRPRIRRERQAKQATAPRRL